jgi:hypothetical protein
MPYNENGHLVSGGQVFIPCHNMMTSREMAENLSPYVGMKGYAFWGEKRTYVRLDAVEGGNVTVHIFRSGNNVTCLAELAFATHGAALEN